VLYCPLEFDYPGIDRIIVRFTRKQCFMFPLQITMANYYSDSEGPFFSEWDKWTDGLGDSAVVPAFF
jgi:hypothetical protein